MLTHNIAGIGGSFMRSFSLAKQLVKLGHEVTLLASRKIVGWRPQTELLAGVRVIQMIDFLPEVLRHGGLSPIDLCGRIMHSIGNQYDLIHGFDHRPVVSLPALVGQTYHHVPYIADWADLWGHGGIADQRDFISRVFVGASDHFWESVSRQKAGYITSISSELTRRCEQMGISKNHIQEIAVGANIDEIHPLSKVKMRIKYDLPINAPIVVHIGYVDYDTPLLVETFVNMARKNPQVHLLMTGGDIPEIRHLAQRTGVADRVRCFGIMPYEKLEEILACGDVMLLPYTNCSINLARFPNRSGDYLAAGRPIATNPTGDLGRLIEKHQVGVVAPDNPNSFADAILSLLKNSTLMAEMGARARKLAETQLSWLSLAKKLDQFYRFVVAEHGVILTNRN